VDETGFQKKWNFFTLQTTISGISFRTQNKFSMSGIGLKAGVLHTPGVRKASFPKNCDFR
jgi:hypothetical protein